MHLGFIGVEWSSFISTAYMAPKLNPKLYFLASLNPSSALACMTHRLTREFNEQQSRKKPSD